MRIVDLIKEKRDGHAHSPEAIRYIVTGAADKTIPDYQLAAWLMAVLFKGMTIEETTELTRAMAHSGEVMDLSDIPGIKVDKHSTGGVGDKVTLVLAPLVASAGAVVAKLSGRGLGHTGGTIDKLEAIAGFQTSLSTEHFQTQLKEIGVAIAGQTQNLAPADGVFYALRDVTGTVESIPLIAASVLSKKIAAGSDVILLDVKYGGGAFMHDFASARELATTMVDVGTRLGKSISVALSDMDQPLGHNVGHALEVAESIATLRGDGPKDLTDLCLKLGGILVAGAKLTPDAESGEALLRAKIADGSALAKFRDLIAAQGGDVRVIEEPGRMPQASLKVPVLAPQDGYVSELDALAVGHACKVLGAGRERKGEPIDLAVGVAVHVKRGDKVRAGETLATLYANDAAKAEVAAAELLRAYHWSDTAPAAQPLVREVILAPDLR
ncbi:MAG: thymidine phosphorylase [Candidatus Sericytochromatia bacterium]|nr:thymidine phosphorylase [Candidatus Sericytochromatia bacterium]